MRDIDILNEVNYKYEWKSNYELKGPVPKKFIERLFILLNAGMEYFNVVDGRFIGRISSLDGPMNTLQIISDHSLSDERSPFIIIKVLYNISDTPVFQMQIYKNNLVVFCFNNGHWANAISRVANRLIKTRKAAI